MGLNSQLGREFLFYFPTPDCQSRLFDNLEILYWPEAYHGHNVYRLFGALYVDYLTVGNVYVIGSHRIVTPGALVRITPVKYDHTEFIPDTLFFVRCPTIVPGYALHTWATTDLSLPWTGIH